MFLRLAAGILVLDARLRGSRVGGSCQGSQSVRSPSPETLVLGPLHSVRQVMYGRRRWRKVSGCMFTTGSGCRGHSKLGLNARQMRGVAPGVPSDPGGQ